MSMVDINGIIREMTPEEETEFMGESREEEYDDQNVQSE